MIAQLRVTGPRAFLDALTLMEETLPIFIGYEDPPYTTAQIRSLYPKGPRVPLTKELSFEYRSIPAPNIPEAIERLIAEVNVSHEGLRFGLASGNNKDRVRVIPTDTSQGLLSDTKVSLECRDATFRDILSSLCKQVSFATGVSLLLHLPLSRRFINDLVTISLDNLPLWEALDRLSEHYNRHHDLMNWKIVRDGEGIAALRVHRVARSALTGDTIFIHSESERPLLDAVKFIQKDLKCRISYEDPIFKCPCQILTDSAGDPQDPRGGVLSFKYRPTEPPLTVLTQLASRFHGTLGIAKYHIASNSSTLALVPYQTKDESGEYIPNESVLETEVSTKVTKGSLAAASAQLMAAFQQSTGIVAHVSGAPAATLKSPVTIEKKSLRDSIDGLLFGIDPSLRWSLLFHPRNKSYELKMYHP